MDRDNLVELTWTRVLAPIIKLNRILFSTSMTSTNVWIIFWKIIFTGAEGWQSAVQWRPRMT
jgi:hypothetical protein